MKVVYCLNSLSTFGGIETVTITKANWLANNPDNQIWIVACCDDSLKTCIPLSDKVGFLGIKNRITWRFPWNIIQLIFKRAELKRELGQILFQINPDILISTGEVEKWVLPYIKGNWSLIREVHFVKDFRKRDISSPKDRLLTPLANILDYSFNIKSFHHIVVLTQDDKIKNWRNHYNISVIPNPIRFNLLSRSTQENKRILSIGRLVYAKNFSSLLRVFSLVVKQYPEWRLDIYGMGPDYEQLQSEIVSYGLLSSVRLMGINPRIEEALPKYSIFACSSRFEGQSMAILEAMACGLPIVSYDCPYGPRSVIRDSIDGFLVPPGEETTMADRICQLAGDISLRKRMGTSALERSKDYRIERIGKMWEELFQQLNNGSHAK